MKQTTKVSAIALSIIILTTVFLTSCQTVPKDIPFDLSEEELVQLAQNSYDNGNSKAAMSPANYKKKLDRYSQHGQYGRGFEETEKDAVGGNEEEKKKEWPSKRLDKSKSWTGLYSLAKATDAIPILA